MKTARRAEGDRESIRYTEHMKIVFRTLVAVSRVLVASAVLAQSAVGNWNGKVKIDKSKVKIPANLNPTQRQQAMSSMAQMEKMTMKLSVRKDTSFVLTFAGGPKGVDRKLEGKWKLQGNKLTLSATKQNDKPLPKADPNPLTLTISKDGKTMTNTPKPGAPSRVVFTR